MFATRNQTALRRGIGIATVLLCGAWALAACDRLEDRSYFNGRYYPAKANEVDGDLAHFVVAVRRINQGMDGARQAARYESVRYCIKNFGTSEIIWQAPPDRPVGEADVQGGRFVVQGKCVEW